MPELPEVETIVRDLRGFLSGKTITGVSFLRRSVWRRKVKDSQLAGAEIRRLERKAKNILIYLSNDLVLIIHLKMTGRLTYENPSAPLKKHTHFIAELSDGCQLRFNDIRRFGYLDLAKVSDLDKLPYLAALGPDALKIPRDDFIALLQNKKRIVKSLLLDQTVIAGLGNIYSDEALFLAGIHPRRVSATLSRNKTAKLYDSVITVLNNAINSRGSSIDDYVDASGSKGSFQDQHQVYGRDGEPCNKCRRIIKRETIGSRSSHFCPRCQK